jgi:hypothetical protein
VETKTEEVGREELPSGRIEADHDGVTSRILGERSINQESWVG